MIGSPAEHYVMEIAQLLFFELDRKGVVLKTNTYTKSTLGEVQGMAFSYLLVDFNGDFSLDDATDRAEGEQLLSVNRQGNDPLSYLCTFVRSEDGIKVFGRLNTTDLESMGSELGRLNQKLANTTRELHKKTVKLEKALEQIRTLEGIIPICMHCHAIRNDAQIWKRLEVYIEEHSTAQFSHSICDKCLEKYYPEDADDDDEA